MVLQGDRAGHREGSRRGLAPGHISPSGTEATVPLCHPFLGGSPALQLGTHPIAQMRTLGFLKGEHLPQVTWSPDWGLQAPVLSSLQTEL